MLSTVALGAAGLAIGAPAAQAAINIDDVTVTETNANVDATFTITRSAGLFAGAVALNYASVNGSARAPEDIFAASGTVAFPSSLLGGTQTRQVTVTVKGDRLDEVTESFGLQLSGPELGKSLGIGAIIDDDVQPTMKADDAPVATEGGNATFPITLSGASGREISVQVTTVDGTATAPADYTTRAGTLTIPAGATSGNIVVPIIDDSATEPEEKFGLFIAKPVNATLVDPNAVGTIIDRVAQPPPPGTPPGTPPPPPPPPPPPSSTGFVPFGPPGSGSGVGPNSNTTTTTSSSARLGLSAPRLKRPATALITLSCPKGSGRCSGRVTIFSRPNKKSKLASLRKERRLAGRAFSIGAGRVQTVQLPLGRLDRSLLLRAGRINVRGYVVSKIGTGASRTRSINGTLVARTNHS